MSADHPRVVSLAGAEVHAQPAIADELAQLTSTWGTLYDWAGGQPQPTALRGRAPVYVALMPGARRQVVVRHGWHGGLLAPVTRDLFRRPTRAPLELARSATLRALGIPTTEVLGYALYPAPLGLARVDVVSAYVDDTADLGMVIAGLAPHVDCDAALDATLDLLAQLARHAVVHPDLNVKNILLHTVRGRAPEAMVIDIDVVRVGGASPAATMERNVSRLVRSLQKWRRHFGCDLADQRIAAFAAAAHARTPQRAL
jgi:3-deoxy-D-manno-octulosonic acid kinase